MPGIDVHPSRQQHPDDREMAHLASCDKKRVMRPVLVADVQQPRVLP